MAADTVPAAPVLRGVLDNQRRTLALWGIAVAAVCAMYTAFYPAMGGGEEMEALIAAMPEALVEALGYDQIGTPAGFLSSTVYGLLGPVLLLVFAIGTGARLIAGQEEDGTLELELASPAPRRQVYRERLAGLWLDVVVLVAVVTVTTLGLVVGLGMDVGADRMLAGSTGLLLLVLGFGTLSFAVGAATGRRAIALGTAAGLAVLAYVFNAIGPTVGQEWMASVSPFGWYLGGRPLFDGFDAAGLLQLAAVPVIAGAGGLWQFLRRDLLV